MQDRSPPVRTKSTCDARPDHTSGQSRPTHRTKQYLYSITPVGVGECASTHFNWRMTVPSETVGAATPVLPAFLPTHSRATRTLSSAPALSWIDGYR